MLDIRELVQLNGIIIYVMEGMKSKKQHLNKKLKRYKRLIKPFVPFSLYVWACFFFFTASTTVDVIIIISNSFTETL